MQRVGGKSEVEREVQRVGGKSEVERGGKSDGKENLLVGGDFATIVFLFNFVVGIGCEVTFSIIS